MKRMMTMLAVLVGLVLPGVAQADQAQTMTAPKAKFYVRKALNSQRQLDYSDKRGSVQDCKKLSRSRQRCEAWWSSDRYFYTGHVTVWFVANDTEHFYWNYALKRTNYDCLRNHGWSHCTKRIYS